MSFLVGRREYKSTYVDDNYRSHQDQLLKSNFIYYVSQMGIFHFINITKAYHFFLQLFKICEPWAQNGPFWI